MIAIFVGFRGALRAIILLLVEMDIFSVAFWTGEDENDDDESSVLTMPAAFEEEATEMTGTLSEGFY